MNIVIHTAARTHILKETAMDPLAVYRKVNVESSFNLANQASSQGVERFLFLSSIGVHGSFTNIDDPLRAEDAYNPHNAYSISKMEAELCLYKVSEETGMDVVCIRPPLVYGPGVKGNFLLLLQVIKSGLPLPLGAVHNQRSFVALDNLVDLIVTCLNHPAAVNQSFLVSDGEDLSTKELLQRIYKLMDKPDLLIPVPPALLKWGAKLLGKENVAQQLLGNLQLDISKNKNFLDWTPPISVDEGLKKTIEWYKKQ